MLVTLQHADRKYWKFKFNCNFRHTFVRCGQKPPAYQIITYERKLQVFHCRVVRLVATVTQLSAVNHSCRDNRHVWWLCKHHQQPSSLSSSPPSLSSHQWRRQDFVTGGSEVWIYRGSRVRSPPVPVVLSVYQRGSLLDGLAMYLSCNTKKFHDNESTHILHNYWTSTRRGGG